MADLCNAQWKGTLKKGKAREKKHLGGLCATALLRCYLGCVLSVPAAVPARHSCERVTFPSLLADEPSEPKPVRGSEVVAPILLEPVLVNISYTR